MGFTVRTKQNIGIISIIDETELKNLPEFQRQIKLICKKTNYRIIIDFSKADYLNSSHIGELLLLYKTVLNFSGKICFCGVKSKMIKQTLEVTNLYKLFEVFEDVNSAIEEYF